LSLRWLANAAVTAFRTLRRRIAVAVGTTLCSLPSNCCHQMVLATHWPRVSTMMLGLRPIRSHRRDLPTFCPFW